MPSAYIFACCSRRRKPIPSSPSPTSSVTFHLFPLLPTELQRQIWLQACYNCCVFWDQWYSNHENLPGKNEAHIPVFWRGAHALVIDKRQWMSLMLASPGAHEVGNRVAAPRPNWEHVEPFKLVMGCGTLVEDHVSVGTSQKWKGTKTAKYRGRRGSA